MKKRILSLFLTIALIISLIPAAITEASASYDYEDGSNQLLSISVGDIVYGKSFSISWDKVSSETIRRYEDMMEWLAKVYVNTLNVIHYMHDKYRSH